jgi:hypothetical protein
MTFLDANPGFRVDSTHRTAVQQIRRLLQIVKGLTEMWKPVKTGARSEGGGRGQEVSHLAFTTTGKAHQLRPGVASLANWRGRGVIAGAEWIGIAGRGYDLSCRPYLRTATRFDHSC